MKTQYQIKLTKIIYVVVLVIGFLISMINGGIAGFRDGWNHVNTSSGSGNNDLSFSQGFLILIISFFALRIFVYLYRFINSIELGEVFSVENIQRLYLAGWYCVSVPFLLFIFNCLNLDKLSINNVLNVDFEFWLLILGITLLTIAFVFKKGLELKQENDFTI